MLIKVLLQMITQGDEPSEKIRNDIKSSCPKAIDISDRAEAIFRAICDLEAGDNLVVAGKGHETDQIIGNTIYPFDDVEQVSITVEILDKADH